MTLAQPCLSIGLSSPNSCSSSHPPSSKRDFVEGGGPPGHLLPTQAHLSSSHLPLTKLFLVCVNVHLCGDHGPFAKVHLGK